MSTLGAIAQSSPSSSRDTRPRPSAGPRRTRGSGAAAPHDDALIERIAIGDLDAAVEPR